jgi:O-antigen ligase
MAPASCVLPGDNRPAAALRGGVLALLAAALALIWVEAAWVTLTVEGAVLLMAAGVAVFRGVAARPAPLWALMAMAAIGITQLALGSAAHPFDAARGALFWLALAAAAFLTATCWHGAEADALLAAAAAGAVAVTAIAALQHFSSAGRYFWIWPSGQSSVFGPFQSRNNFASFILLFLPICARRGLGQSGSGRWAWLTGAALMSGTAVASGSRAGAGLAVLSLAALFVQAPASGAAKRRVAMLAVSATVVSTVLGWETLTHKLADSDPLRYRREMMLSAASMAAARPLTGFGLGSFPAAYPAYARFDSGHFVNHAHNDWLEIAAEAGIAGCLLLGGGILRFLAGRPAHPAALGVALVSLHALVDYPFQRFGLAVWIVVVIAAACSSTSARYPTQKV